MRRDFTSLLVANRGEIALRIMRTARAAGLRCIAVHTDADARAPHVDFADEAVRIGTGPVADSYLSVRAILDAARASGAQAIHPGYGFLSENAGFARAVGQAGLVFIGPSPEAIELMGDKSTARRLMREAGIACVPGYDGADQSDATLRAEADRIGYPVMIKAAMGGGGKGMRAVAAPGDFDAALTLVRAEAQAAFGAGNVILERAIANPRHVEFQIIGDAHGHVLHLGERDCSVQRRHQKVIEEAPCPVLTQDLRERMGEAAIAAARAVGYEGAGTVEFLLDGEEFFFLEMNTRLQVEHGVTEAVTGRDLVALQLDVARGEPLGFGQSDVTFSGHAIEARLYAEDPGNDFLPATGLVRRWTPGQGARVDAGIVEGLEITPFYDPLLARIIAHGATREAARARLIETLGDTVIFGVTSNRDFLIRALSHPDFAAGTATTGFIDTGFAGDLAVMPGFGDVALAAALLYRHLAQAARDASLGVAGELVGWSSRGALRAHLRLGHGDRVFGLSLRDAGGTICVTCDGDTTRITGRGAKMRLDGRRSGLRDYLVADGAVYMAFADRIVTMRHLTASVAPDAPTGDGTVAAPMHGVLAELLVQEGDIVAPGTRLAVLEAMKMRHDLRATIAGRVTRVGARAGAQVRAGDIVIEIGEDT